MTPHCCICRSTDDVVWCHVCGHNFCARHRTLLWGNWKPAAERAVAAVKQLILRLGPPPHCAGNHDGR